MKIDVFTLFPEWFDWLSSQRHISNAVESGTQLEYVNYRDYTQLSGRQVDDTPFGGGAGMVLRVDVVADALSGRYEVDATEVKQQRRVIALSPAGRQLDAELVSELAQQQELTLLCGRYEGFDERIVTELAGEAISVGPYVLSGGEIAAMVTIDAVLRHLPGALGDERSAVEESFSEALGGKVEYPQFTRPANYRGWEVPEVLLSGDHERIREWRDQHLR